NEVPTITDDAYFSKAFNALQTLINEGAIAAGHDISSGGLITTLLEMCFADVNLAADLDLSDLGEDDVVKLFFSENCGIVFQLTDAASESRLKDLGIDCFKIGKVTEGESLRIRNGNDYLEFNIPKLRDTWTKTSFLLDQQQS